MSRLLSAWNQKFELQYDGLNQYLQYVKKIVRFERPEYEKNNHLVSLEAFSDYVAHLEDDNAYNEHWKRFVLSDYRCGCPDETEHSESGFRTYFSA